MTNITKKDAAKACGWSLENKDSLTLHSEIYTFRIMFFYKHGRTAQQVFKPYLDNFKKAGLIASDIQYGEKDFPFRGSAGIKESSHWWMKCKLTDPSKCKTPT